MTMIMLLGGWGGVGALSRATAAGALVTIWRRRLQRQQTSLHHFASAAVGVLNNISQRICCKSPMLVFGAKLI